MISRRFSRTIVLLLIVLLPVACSTPQSTSTLSPPTATFTAVPPTATSTAVPPTATSTAVPPTATETAVPPTATATSTSTPLPLLCEGVEGTCVEFRFVAGKCRRVGPELIPSGAMTLILSNYTSGEAGIDVEILDEGKTWSDMRNHFKDGSTAFQPAWAEDVTSVRMLPGEHHTSVHELIAGTYISVCWSGSPHQIWLAGKLIVAK